MQGLGAREHGARLPCVAAPVDVLLYKPFQVLAGSKTSALALARSWLNFVSVSVQEYRYLHI